ncbi:MAG: hypothetical protein B7Z55_03500 [Planctomycetales bacterium 12-60-4]|nr:MAG: hypothetical protein B7Z55_03500 [Planctomycetales bacterium 12-60-4]
MGSFGHEPVAKSEPEDVVVAARNSRYGLALFALYFAFYAGFVGLNAFAPSTMAMNLAGINLAIWYGLGLIIVAMVLAIVYTLLCRRKADAG